MKRLLSLFALFVKKTPDYEGLEAVLRAHFSQLPKEQSLPPLSFAVKEPVAQSLRFKWAFAGAAFSAAAVLFAFSFAVPNQNENNAEIAYRQITENPTVDDYFLVAEYLPIEGTLAESELLAYAENDENDDSVGFLEAAL